MPIADRLALGAALVVALGFVLVGFPWLILEVDNPIATIIITLGAIFALCLLAYVVEDATTAHRYMLKQRAHKGDPHG